MAKYRLKIEGIDDIDPTPFDGKIEIYYNTETNAVEVNTPTRQAVVTEAEPDLSLGTEPSDGDVLTYNAAQGKWLNAVPSIPSLENIGDIDFETLSDGDVLIYNAATGKWENKTNDNMALSGLDDVLLTDISDKQLLAYDNVSEEWHNTSNVVLGNNSTAVETQYVAGDSVETAGATSPHTTSIIGAQLTLTYTGLAGATVWDPTSLGLGTELLDATATYRLMVVSLVDQVLTVNAMSEADAIAFATAHPTDETEIATPYGLTLSVPFVINHINTVVLGDDITATDDNTVYTDKIVLNDDAGIVIEGEYIKSKVYADDENSDNPYIDMYEGGFDVYLGDTDFYLTPNSGYLGIDPGDGETYRIGIDNTKKIYFGRGAQFASFDLSSLTGTRAFAFPDAAGTLALTSDIVQTDKIVITGSTINDTKTTIGSATDIVIPTNTIRNFSVKGVGVGNEGNKITYTGTPEGCSTPVTVTAVYGGSIHNGEQIGFDGIKTINDGITWYNNLYPNEPVSLISGTGTQVPTNKATILLTGGTDVYHCASYNIVGTAKNIGGTVTVANVASSEITDELTITGMNAEADDTNNSLLITATGKASTKINWSAKVEWHDITFA